MILYWDPFLFQREAYAKEDRKEGKQVSVDFYFRYFFLFVENIKQNVMNLKLRKWKDVNIKLENLAYMWYHWLIVK